LVILPIAVISFTLAFGEGLSAVGCRRQVCLLSTYKMSSPNPNSEKDWTHLLTDPELVGHIGKLLQAYREAPADRREEALLSAMRKIRKGAAGSGKAASGADQVAVETTASVAPTTAQSPRTVQSSAAAAPAIKTVVAAPALAQDPSPTDQPPFVPDLFTPSHGQDRRTYPRLRCFIAVELKCEGWDVPVWGNLANVSASGCFIETMEPVRKSTKLEVGLWANNGKIWVKGIVINGVVTENNPTFGVRLKYTNMDASDRDTLRFFLKFVEDTTKSYEKQNGYLAQLKR
jgi:hypothetical protein